MEKYCILEEERLCVDCGDCLTCDLDPEKRCDSCMQCIQKSGADYAAIEIDEVINGTLPDEQPDFPVKPTQAKVSEKASAVKAIRVRRPRKAL